MAMKPTASERNRVSRMAARTHRYAVIVRWTGNTGSGTSGYRSYKRDYEIASTLGKPPIPGSSDPAFRGDATRWNPEEMLVAALSACHKLWYLHLCAEEGVIVKEYFDDAEGLMEETPDGSGRFLKVTLKPNQRGLF
jgi:organic hydroperoxide reductase OsmC/OhrA